MKLLERDELLAQLQRAAAGPGILVFVEGEAGIGKAAVLKSFADMQPAEVPVLILSRSICEVDRPLEFALRLMTRVSECGQI